MNAGKITAKLRDAVPVQFFEEGEERIQYKNIDIPDSLKTLDLFDFGFNVELDGKITFRLHFEKGVLPAEFPSAREKTTRAEKVAEKAAKVEEAAPTEDMAAAAIEAATGSEAVMDTEIAEEAAETPETPAIPEYRFNVLGSRRKELVVANSEYLNQPWKYLAAPSLAYTVGEYRIDKAGTLLGEASPELLAALTNQGFTHD
jgi:hypothetical protein